MTEESATNPVAETETPVSETEVAIAPEAEGHQPEGEQTEPVIAEEEVPDEETEEVEHEGQKYRVAKALKPLLMFQADYTRKTQELAETRRQTEARHAELQEQETRLKQQSEAQQANLVEVARLVGMNDQIEQFRKLNWDEIWQQDPAQHGRLVQQFNLLKDTRDQLAGQLQQKENQRIAEEQQRAFQTQRETARRLEEANEALRRDIPNWSPELRDKLKGFAMAKGGLTPDEVGSIADPRFVKLLHLAYLGDQLSQKSRQAAKPQAPAAKPVPSVTARSAPAAKDPERMTTEEWMKHRSKQVEARNAANLPFHTRNR